MSRMLASAKNEDESKVELEADGWNVKPYGAALLDVETRDVLQKYRTPDNENILVRWLPDFLASKVINDRLRIAFFDAKCGSDTPNYAIEIDARDALFRFQHFRARCYFLFPGLMVLTPGKVKEFGRPGPPPSIAGSGTPYVLVAKSYAVPLSSFY